MAATIRRSGSLVCCALLLGLAWPALAQGDEWQPHTAAGKKAYDAADYVAAEKEFRAALRSAKAFPQSDPRLGASLNNVAAACRAQGKFREAEATYKQLLALRERELGPEDPKLVETLNELAVSYQAEHRFSRAEQLQKRVLAIREKAYGPEHLAVAESLNNLGALYYFEGRYGSGPVSSAYIFPSSIVFFGLPARNVVSLFVAGRPPTTYTAPTGERKRAYAAAEELFRQSLAIQERILEDDDARLGPVLFNLGTVCYFETNWQEAETHFARLVRILEKSAPPEDLKLANALMSLALAYHADGKDAEAQELIQRRLALREKTLGQESIDLAAELNNLAMLQRAMGDNAQAETLFRRSLSILDQHDDSRKQHITVLENYAAFLRESGRTAEAKKAAAEAAVVRTKKKAGH